MSETPSAAQVIRARCHPGAKIHPVIIYPFRQPEDYSDLEALYSLVARLDTDKARYARPITIIDRKTVLSRNVDTRFRQFSNIVAQHSHVLDAWCVDTCQMWYCGLGLAFENGMAGDVYWLIPGDFNYGTPAGLEVLGRLHDLPEIILELGDDICIGEITTDHCHSKQLIDTYGTFALLYNWFPKEASEIRQFTERPRSEFFAVRHEFLSEVLVQRWYPYEQTVTMLLHAVAKGKRISRFSVGNVSDLPVSGETLGSAMQQVERAERVLKTLWRERHESEPGWVNHYRELEMRSDHVRRTALSILQSLLQ